MPPWAPCPRMSFFLNFYVLLEYSIFKYLNVISFRTVNAPRKK